MTLESCNIHKLFLISSDFEPLYKNLNAKRSISKCLSIPTYKNQGFKNQTKLVILSPLCIGTYLG